MVGWKWGKKIKQNITLKYFPNHGMSFKTRQVTSKMADESDDRTHNIFWSDYMYLLFSLQHGKKLVDVNLLL